MFPPQTEFNPATISDEGLKDLRLRCIDRLAPLAPRLGDWLHGWCDAEQVRRVETPDQTKARHAAAIPLDVREWTDADVGQAMLAITIASFTPADVGAGHLLDRLCLVLATECQRRLAGKDIADER